MKVLGQLEGAQLEQIASTTTTPASRGRVYMDISNPLSGTPMVYNGTAWRPFALDQTFPLIPTTPLNGTVTIDWSQGLNQIVILSSSLNIKFTNPQPGKAHTLVIQGVGSDSIYCYTFDMPDQDPNGGPYQPPVGLTPGTTQSYTWFYSLGVTQGYGTMGSVVGVPVSNPPTLATGIDISKDGKYLLMGRTSTPYTTFYKLATIYSNARLMSVYGAGATPAAAAAQVVGVAYAADTRVAYVASASSPYIQAFLLNDGLPFITYGDPGTLPTGSARCVALHPNNLFVGVGHTTSPFMSIYLGAIQSGGIGAKLSDPGTLPAAQVNGLAWSPQGDYLAAASQTSPYIQVWEFSGTTTVGAIGAISANPSTLPLGGPAGSLGKTIAWRPQGDYIAMAMSTTSPYIYVVPFNRAAGTFGSPLTVSAPPTTSATCVQWTPDGQFLLVGSGATPYLVVYDFSNFTLDTIVGYPASTPGAQVNDIAVHPSGDYCFLALNGGNFSVSVSLPKKIRSYLRVKG